jgi:predicted small lipoprotein YifL
VTAQRAKVSEGCAAPEPAAGAGLRSAVLLVLVAALLGACGQKGALYLPQKGKAVPAQSSGSGQRPATPGTPPSSQLPTLPPTAPESQAPAPPQIPAPGQVPETTPTAPTPGPPAEQPPGQQPDDGRS